MGRRHLAKLVAILCCVVCSPALPVVGTSTLAVFGWPTTALAGGPEFPADGTRGLGRGGARMARADDPSIMTRNPALLADLWDDQALLGAHLLLPDACFQPTGAYGWGVLRDDVSDFGEGPIYLQADEGDTDLQGNPLQGYADEPYPEVCYEGGPIFLPQVGLSMKLDHDLGVGLGFFPPDAASLNQWGNRDGTVDTENGRRPNPLRFYRSHQNVSFFTLMGAVGYRIADWIRVGAGLQWNLAVFSSKTWTTPVSSLDPNQSIETEVFGRDLFIPGVVASVHLRPLDQLDVAVGVKWSDAIDAKAKLDITSGSFGSGEVFEYIDARTGEVNRVGSSIPLTSNDQPGVVDSPPIYAPQLSLGIRWADRLKPHFRDWDKAHQFDEGKVEDHMATERWDVELDVIYYLTSVYDRVAFTNRNAVLQLRTVDENGVEASIPASVGDCLQRDPTTQNCTGRRLTKTSLGGKDQLTVRLGGDYNILPGYASLRAGVSYETNGQEVEMLNVLTYLLGRTGLHAGFTLRVADKTDISFGFAHFIHRDVKLQVNPASDYPRKYKAPDVAAEYNFEPGAGEADFSGEGAEGGDFDGVAGVEVPNAGQEEPGPYFINAGTFTYDMQVMSVSFTQHF